MNWATQLIEKLLNSEIVKFRPRGNSMTPLVFSGDLCTVKPFSDLRQPKVGDVVLCKVKGRNYFHLIKAIRGKQYQIGNNKGHINGWTNRDKVYGYLDSWEDSNARDKRHLTSIRIMEED